MASRGVCTSSRAGSAGTSATVTLTFPVGTVVGDRIACLTDTNALSVTCTAASGANTWTATDGPIGNVSATAYYFRRVLDATDVATGSVTFTWSAAGRVQAMGQVWPAGDTATPFGTFATSTSALNTATAPALTTGSASSEVAMTIGARVAASNFTSVVVVPATYTKDSGVITTVATNANTEADTAHLTTPVASGSSVGGGSLTSGGAATHWFIYLDELRSAVSATVAAAVATVAVQAFPATFTGGAAVAPPAATVTAQAHAGTFTGGATVQAAVATVSAQALPATFVGTSITHATVNAAVATVTTQAHAATVTGGAAVTGAVAAVTSTAHAGSFTGGAGVDAATAVVTTQAHAGAFTGGAVINMATAQVTATAYPATLRILAPPRDVTVLAVTEHARVTTITEHPRVTTVTDRSQT